MTSHYLLIIPVAFLVACSQIVIKLRAAHIETGAASSVPEKLLAFSSDPAILMAYGAALFASFAWLYVVTKLPLTIAFPVYIGTTFLFVAVGGVLFLGEPWSMQKLGAMLLVLGGILMGLSSDA